MLVHEVSETLVNPPLGRRRTSAILLLMNNDGYATERMIHEGPYNNIQPWNYHQLPEVFGGGWGRRVTTEDELDDGLARARASNDGPVLIEIMLGRFDTSEALKRLCGELSPDKGRQTAKVGAKRTTRQGLSGRTKSGVDSEGLAVSSLWLRLTSRNRMAPT